MYNIIILLISLYKPSITHHGYSSPKPERRNIYFVRANNLAVPSKRIKVFSLYEDSTVVGLLGTGIIINKSSIEFYPENGYTKVVGNFSSNKKQLYLNYSVISRTVSVVGEKLPSVYVVIPAHFKNTNCLVIDNEYYYLYSPKRIPNLLKEALLPPKR